MKIRIIVILGLLAFAFHSIAQDKNSWEQKFEQIDPLLPTPNGFRSASGAPGPKYWANRADYNMSVSIDDEIQRLTGTEKITYHNNSPQSLDYLWVQLDQNVRAEDTDTWKISTNDGYFGSSIKDTISATTMRSISGNYDYDGGFKIQAVKDSKGSDLTYTINKTMMRVELPAELQSGDSFEFQIDWYYNINNRLNVSGRSGCEYFEEDGNWLYTLAQFFPRMAVYDDVNGWQNKQFLGRGEFALPFGNYKVSITVPADHIVASTGSLQNPEEVLTKAQMERLEKAKTASEPMLIVSQEEAIKNEKSRSKKTKTWTYHADDVRDFAFASSRKFIWDAMGVEVGENRPMAMSFYPKEGNPMWGEVSTWAVVNTLITYSKYTINYPYPVAISVDGTNGMEYPMICFNGGRPDADGNYTERKKYRLIGLVIHEVGHNFFPMIINNDERQWTWMDEGLNSFVQYRTQVERYENFPHRRGPAKNIVPYMKGDKSYIRPIMTNSENIVQFGNNAYAKPATALNILRETVMGPELFDYAFKEYARRWAFKNPEPADFFRTMEDASAVDLDWFWRGWFYTTDHVDIEMDNVRWFKMQSDEKGFEKRVKSSQKTLASNGAGEKNTDFSDGPSYFYVKDAQQRSEFRSAIDNTKIKALHDGLNFYEVTLNNVGGLVMPIVVEWTYADGSKEVEKIPAEIWRKNEQQVTKVFAKEKEVVNITIDPNLETADTETGNNYFPIRESASRFDKFKESK